MAKGKKKGKKKKKTEKPEGALTEVDRTFYELTITDLNRKLARLRSANTELEDKNQNLTEQLQKLDEDRNDVIIYLKRILQERNDEIAELQTGISKLQETLNSDKEECEQKIQQMEEEYKQMHEQLTSEIKLLEGKLNALEEFRVQREDLMKKFEIQETEMEEQEIRHKKALYETERKFIIAKDKLKKEMEARLLQLSTEFQDATEIRIAATTHRVIRENIAINNELDEMLNVHKRLYSENQEMKQRDTTLRQQVQLHNKEKIKALSKTRVQMKIIKELTNEHESMNDKLSRFSQIEQDMHKSQEDLYNANLKVQFLENKIRILEQNLHGAKCCIKSLEMDLEYNKSEAIRLEAVILEAVGSIKEATKIQKSFKTTDKPSVLATKRENLLNHLYKLMITAKDTKITKPSLTSVSSTESVYKRGDLGFVPPDSSTKPIRSSLRAIRAIESQTGSSLREVSEDARRISSLIPIAVEDGQVEEDLAGEEEESQQSDVYFEEDESLEEEEILMGEDEEVVEDEDGVGFSRKKSSVGKVASVEKRTSSVGKVASVEKRTSSLKSLEKSGSKTRKSGNSLVKSDLNLENK